MGAIETEDLFQGVRNPDGTQMINGRCLIRTQDQHRVVLVSGITLAQYALTDEMAEAYAMVNLVQQGWATQRDVARAFDCSERTVRRDQRRFDEGGLAALGRHRGYPADQQRLSTSRSGWISRLKTQGYSNRGIARRAGVSEKAIRKTLHRLGWKEPQRQLDLIPSKDSKGADPKLSAFSTSGTETAPVSADTDPSDRRTDRLLARLGLLEDAPPLFGSAKAVARAGVLLAVPVLVASGVFECAHKIYGSLGAAFYGLRTSLLTLLLMALWRIKRPEGLKEYSPVDLGRVLGLDRVPEVKTLRRKLVLLSAAGRAAQFGTALAQQRIAVRGIMGFLYIDGHVRVYHGRHALPKAHVAKTRFFMPATTDYWINESGGDPLFVLTVDANASLVRMLPELLRHIRGLVGRRRITIVFDRGGFSPKLFQQMLAEGFDLLTYRKGQRGRSRKVPRRSFKTCRTRLGGRLSTYYLADQEVRLLKGKLQLRQVTRLTGNGHQTPILTSRRDLSAAQVAYRMFDRWRQENFFKYLSQEYALDALVDYATTTDDPARDVPNPAWAAANAKLQRGSASLEKLQAEYGLEAWTNLEQQRRTMRGFKAAHSKLGRKIQTALEQIRQLKKQRDAIPARVPVQSLHQEPVVKLAPERKHLTNLMKMIAYQSESDLLRLVVPCYRRVEDEGRTLIQSALASAADLRVTRKELRVTLAAQSSPHRTRAIAQLCCDLNAMKTRFPGSKLRMRYAIRQPS